MSDVLMTGFLGCLSCGVCDGVAREFRVVLAGEGAPVRGKHGNMTAFSRGMDEVCFGELFDAYDFGTAFYFSGFLEGGDGLSGEERALDRFLKCCADSEGVKAAVFLPVEVLNYGGTDVGSGADGGRLSFSEGRVVRLHHLEDLCLFYRERFHLDLTVVRLPFLAERGFYGNYLGGLFEGLARKKPVRFPFCKADPVDFLSMEDFTGLLLRMADAEEFGMETLLISSGFSHTYGELAECLGVGDTAEYGEELCLIPSTAYPVRARRKFGWFPKTDVFAEAADFYAEFLNSFGRKKKSGPGVQGNRWKKGGLVKYAELIVIFALVEFLNRMFGATVYFKFVDLRLLFVVMMGTIYGMKMGLFASLLASAAMAVRFAGMGIDYSVLFYNVDNWIPFVAYFMAGSISGYGRNKKEDELHFLKKDYELLRDKYLYLNQIYQDSLVNKKEYKRQILGYKDSFGKIFNAVQRLDNLLPEKIFSEALELFEEQLDNHSLAIYTVDRWQKYARLVVSSNAVARGLNRSLALADFPEMTEPVFRGEVFKNSKLLFQYPSYASSIRKDGRVVLLIVVYRASPEQYGMYYMNLFRILTGLTQNSFLHALEYNELAEEKLYERDTHIMKKERFAEVLEVRKEMMQKQIADYILLRLITEDRRRTAEVLGRLIRSTDILGEGADGELYLLLAQVDDSNFRFVEERLKSSGVEFVKMEGVE